VKDKQWLLEKLTEIKNKTPMTVSWAFEETINYVEKLEEPQKPVVPQFVADWFELNKIALNARIYNFSVTLFHKDGKDFDEFESWFRDTENESIVTLVKMLNGYEIEEEPKYVVRFPDSKFGTPTYGTIVRNYDKKKMSVIYGSPGVNIKPNKYTEEEIKEVGERYWQFAEKVED